ncbi:hypothetical protein V8E51_000157 [Hyaloscypha variabilis]
MSYQASPFLTLLPFEIRLQIYSEVLGSHTILLHLTNNGESLTVPRDLLALKLLSLPLTCHQISAETLPLLYTTNTYTLHTPTALRYLSRLPCNPQIRTLHFTFPLPHLPYFTNLPHTLSPPTNLNLIDNPKNPLQPQDLTWIESWDLLQQMHGLKKLQVDLDVPIFWRRNWAASEEEMLYWIEGSRIGVRELVVGVLWDECEEGSASGGRERFGMNEGRGERRWKVERVQKKEENDVWQREWGYLADLSMSA